jgi:hypothetical protein
MAPALENTGLRIMAVRSAVELTSDMREHFEQPHAVNLALTEPDWPTFDASDVVVRPSFVHWVCSALDGAGGLLRGQSKKQRYRTRNSLVNLASLRMQVHDPIDRDVLREWTTLYRRQVRRLRHGRDLASLFRRELLDPQSGHALVSWRLDGNMVCGSIIKHDVTRSALIVRFNAVADDFRDAELPRAMYAVVADIAKARGAAWVTSGTDPNITGGMVNPGLSAFKLRLGFRPVPANLLGIPTAILAERILSMTGLCTPIIRFCYVGSPTTTGELDSYFDNHSQLALVSVTAPGIPDDVLDAFPRHRRIVLKRPVVA